MRYYIGVWLKTTTSYQNNKTDTFAAASRERQISRQALYFI